ncbi:MAG: glycoside hydrolase family 97 catalytic domain-containing protein, partial [Bacteroidales bacterium]|nr:glycoside hydrolase family 97 catalytic domain-containing protein [Bacteroidales bacterium]
MKKVSILISLLLVITLTGCKATQSELTLLSPDSQNRVELHLSQYGELSYLVYHNNSTIVDTSFISFDFKDQDPIRGNLTVIKSRQSSFNETWELPWGEQREVVNNYNEMVVELKESIPPKRGLKIYFRAYDDGVAFRYEFLPQTGVDSLIIMEEKTEFQLTGDHTAWWIPGDWDSYEHLYNTTPISKVDAMKHNNAPGLGFTNIMDNAVHTPVTMRTNEGVHISIHEAALIDYASMTLKVDTASLKLTSQLVGSERLGYKVKRELPFKTPWRTIQIADKASELIESRLILNLNEPNKLGDVSWVKPMKYMGIWWEMHIDKGSWDYGMTLDDESGKWVDTGKSHGRHAATTENAKKYIDFASENGIKGLLIEGWNTGWERWTGFEDREGIFDFVTPYPDYDIEEVVRYAKERGVEIIMHHETSAAPRTYEQQMDTAYALMQRLGIGSVKSGYVGRIIPKGEHHHGQWMVNHYQRALERAAEYKIAVNAHEPIKATGLRRTYPNAIAREGLRGQEFNAWSPDGGNPPEHISIVAFTRMLAGPIDFTPGVFDISLPTKPNNQINTTLAHQLALYVVIYSPIQMACDLPENYENQPAFMFIRDVGVDW